MCATCCSWAATLSLFLYCSLYATAQEQGYRPQPGEFPQLNRAKEFRGELVFVDHVNRRGSLRLYVDEHFQEGRLHHFAMLPSGVIRYRGAPAALRDIPIGTLLYGHFTLPPDPETSSVPLSNGSDATAPAETHALLLEDGVSRALRTHHHWELQQVSFSNGEGKLTAVYAADDSAAGDTKAEPVELTIDESTSIWRGREILSPADLLAEGIWRADGSVDLKSQRVQLTLGWHPRYLYQQFHLSDLWLDEASLKVSEERQRQRHLRQIRTRWLPARVESVEYGEFGRAVVTAALFGGMDERLYAAFQKDSGAKMAAAEDTLRTWWQDHDGMDGRIVGVSRDTVDPPIGDSGIRVQFEVPLILEGFRPGRIVRLRSHAWPNVKPPVEERVRSFEDRWPDPAVFLR